MHHKQGNFEVPCPQYSAHERSNPTAFNVNLLFDIFYPRHSIHLATIIKCGRHGTEVKRGPAIDFRELHCTAKSVLRNKQLVSKVFAIKHRFLYYEGRHFRTARNSSLSLCPITHLVVNTKARAEARGRCGNNKQENKQQQTHVPGGKAVVNFIVDDIMAASASCGVSGVTDSFHIISMFALCHIAGGA